MRQWFDTAQPTLGPGDPGADRIDWLRAAPFVALHLACLGVIWV
ncbi:MAG: acyl-CoA desaturase, partial [Xanthomonadaceae bacterium]|nr:acyl-CoA desaturase [Xanthomonadaceae bacterium]